MPVVNRAAWMIVLFDQPWPPAPGFAQSPPALTISPDQATMVVGETHTFRATGRDGGMRHNVRWGISPEQSVSLTVNGDEVMVEARNVSSSVLLTAYAEGDPAKATVDIRSSQTLPAGARFGRSPRCRGARAKRCLRRCPAQPIPTSTGRKSARGATLSARLPPTEACCGAGNVPAPVGLFRVSP